MTTSLEQIDLLDPELYATGDPHAAWRRLRSENPVHWHADHEGGGFWALTKYADVVRVSRNSKTFVSSQGIEITGRGMPEAQGRMIIMSDPPRHTQLRLLVSKGFTPRMVRLWEPFVRDLATGLAGRVLELGTCDFVHEAAAVLPMQVICEIMGVPVEDRERVGGLITAFITRGSDAAAADAPPPELFELWQYFHAITDEHRRERRDDLIGALVGAEIDGEGLDEIDLDLFLLLLIGAGIETTRNAISGGFLALAQHPDELARLHADPDLLPTAVEEVLRYTTPVISFARTASTETEIRGRTIRAGDKVALWYSSANRDEDVFADPDRFDMARSPNEHVAFGTGTHFCLGASLARLEIRLMYEELLPRIRSVELTGRAEYAPSFTLRTLRSLPVRVTPR